MVARNPGGRGMKPSSDRSIAELLIWLSRLTQGLCENMSPRYQAAASAADEAEHGADRGVGLAEQSGALGPLPDAKADRGADPLDEQRDADEDADREERLRGPVRGDRPRDRRGDHGPEEEAGEEPRECEGDAAQSATQAGHRENDQEDDDDDVEEVHGRRVCDGRPSPGRDRVSRERIPLSRAAHRPGRRVLV